MSIRLVPSQQTMLGVSHAEERKPKPMWGGPKQAVNVACCFLCDDTVCPCCAPCCLPFQVYCTALACCCPC